LKGARRRLGESDEANVEPGGRYRDRTAEVSVEGNVVVGIERGPEIEQ
jgi:hypothetical protein